MKKLDFRVPFTGFAHLSWFNAFAAAYVHIEGFEGKTDYDCPKETSGQCNGCGNCRGGLGGIQESWYFLFQTLSACAAYQQDFSATLVCPDQDEEVFDFCMKLAGYRYERITEDLPNALRASIDAGNPRNCVDEGGRSRAGEGTHRLRRGRPHHGRAQRRAKPARTSAGLRRHCTPIHNKRKRCARADPAGRAAPDRAGHAVQSGPPHLGRGKGTV